MLLPNVLVGLLAAGTIAATGLAVPPVGAVVSPLESSSLETASLEKVAETFESGASPRPWSTIILHHSATPGGSVASIDAAHRAKKDRAGNPWLGIGYHFVIGNGRQMADGEVQPTFRWLKQLAGAHAGDRQQNERGIGICLIGNFEQAAPTARQIEAVRDLTRILSRRYAISRERVLRHQDIQATACPGRLFPWDQFLAELPRPSQGS